MRLINALEIGVCCGLRTIGEAVDNISIHMPNLFQYEKMYEEMEEIYDDVSELCNKYSMNKDDFYNMSVDRFVRDYVYEYYYPDQKSKDYGCPNIRRIIE